MSNASRSVVTEGKDKHNSRIIQIIGLKKRQRQRLVMLPIDAFDAIRMSERQADQGRFSSTAVGKVNHSLIRSLAVPIGAL